MKNIIAKLQAKEDLNLNDIQQFMEGVIADEIDLDTQKEFLILLNEKGYHPQEVAYFIQVLQSEMSEKLDFPGAIDICGTGGSELPRINTSSTSSFILSSIGVKIAKHGNKAASGRFGSFDLLEALGIDITNAGDQLIPLFQQTNLAFIYARQFHPAIKHFAPVRKLVGHKTIFNLLGPLLNPANPKIQVVGVADESDARLMVEAGKYLGKEKMLVLSGSDRLDELTLTGPTKVLELNGDRIDEYELNPAHFGFEVVDFSEIGSTGNDFNVQISKDILSGKCDSHHLNLVLANCALILKFLNLATTYRSGVEIARQAIQDGLAIQQLEKYARLSRMPSILQKIQQEKIEEVERLKIDYPFKAREIGQSHLRKSDRDFKSALIGKDRLHFICEIKNASPSDPKINVAHHSAERVAQVYEKNGASAISVLTDEKFFKGSLENLKIAREKTSNIPLLMKDFIADEHQIYVGRYFGADAILLIVALLDLDQINHFIQVAHSLNMDVLLEVHNEKELEIALQSKAEIIGINNRDLNTFKIDSKTVLKLAPLIPNDRIVIAESGYNEIELPFINGLTNGVLVGSSLMKSDDIAGTLKQFKQSKKIFKACGIRAVKDAKFCEKNNIPLAGLNFVESSHRCIDLEKAKKIRKELKNTKVVGVFQNQDLNQVMEIANDLDLDFVQLSGEEPPEYCSQIKQPIIKTLSFDQLGLADQFNEHVCMYIVDGQKPGSGESYDYAKLSKLKLNRPFLIAGGVSSDNAAEILEKVPQARGLDSASGIETCEQIDESKINLISSVVKEIGSRK